MAAAVIPELLGSVCAAVTGVAAACAVVWKLVRKCNAVVDGIRCQLRSEMLRTYYRHKDEGCIRQYEMENFVHNYAAYTALGGNSFIENVREEVCAWEIVT